MADAARRLTCHVLDVSRGLPAAGVTVAVTRVDGDGADGAGPVVAVTDADGRSPGPLLAGAGFPAGRYEVTFSLGAHFAGREGVSSPPFLDVVPVRFEVVDDGRHVHVALLATPWSYTAYRGS